MPLLVGTWGLGLGLGSGYGFSIPMDCTGGPLQDALVSYNREPISRAIIIDSRRYHFTLGRDIVVMFPPLDDVIIPGVPYAKLTDA